jgi:hypothetical protein
MCVCPLPLSNTFVSFDWTLDSGTTNSLARALRCCGSSITVDGAARLRSRHQECATVERPLHTHATQPGRVLDSVKIWDQTHAIVKTTVNVTPM